MSLDRFVRVYNSLGIAERSMVCCVIDGEGISWKLAYSEIRGGTELGRRIQENLERRGII